MKKVNPIPEGYSSVTPYLVIKGAARAMEFYKKALGAKELFRMEGPDGAVNHAEMRIGNSNIMLGDEYPDMGYRSPEALKGTPVSFMVYVEDVDAAAATAIEAGMKVVRPVADQFYGDRNGIFTDPFGHVWTLGSHVEDVSPEEMKKRAAALYG